MKSMSTGFFLSTLSMGYFVSSLLVSLVDKVSNGNWLRSNFDEAKLDYFYWMLAMLAVLNFSVFLVFAMKHQYKVQQYTASNGQEKEIQSWNHGAIEDTEKNKGSEEKEGL
ncbi:hypothetical protein ACSBR2_027755 [Camellia fascicularis]